jgi:hypothetical protein
MTELTNGNYYYFLREPGPFGLGHMGWGLSAGNSRWLYGALENVGGQPAVLTGDNDNWFAWADSEAEMLHEMRTMETASRLCDRPAMDGYTFYKRILVNHPTPEAAEEVARGQWGYGALINNCLDIAARIGDAYGVPVWSWSRHLGGLATIQNMAPKGYFYHTLWQYNAYTL